MNKQETSALDHITVKIYDKSKQIKLLTEIVRSHKFNGKKVTTQIIKTQIGEKITLPVYNKARTRIIHPADSFPIILTKVIHHR